MSYQQMMKWNRKHPKGTRQYMGFDCCSCFTPAIAWLEQDWWPYVELCKQSDVKPMEQKTFYDLGCRGHIMSGMTLEAQVEYTRLISIKEAMK